MRGGPVARARAGRGGQVRRHIDDGRPRGSLNQRERRGRNRDPRGGPDHPARMRKFSSGLDSVCPDVPGLRRADRSTPQGDRRHRHDDRIVRCTGARRTQRAHRNSYSRCCRSNSYAPNSDAGARCNDPEIAPSAQWPRPNRTLRRRNGGPDPLGALTRRPRRVLMRPSLPPDDPPTTPKEPTR